MNQKIFIDIESNNEYVNLIGNYLYSELLNKGYDATLLDNNTNINDKIRKINNETKETIVISNRINVNNEIGSEIIYSLKDTNRLATSIQNNLGNYTNIAKFYQLRLPSDTALDYYQIIRETPNAETIIISYNANDLSEMQNDWEDVGQAILDGLLDYITKQNIYIVQSGDSLYSIAQKFEITVQDLINANSLGSSSSLSIGQELIIPDKTTTPEVPETPTTTNTYTVQSGDSLYSIARRFNTTVDAIKSLNNLSTNTLSIGKVLVLPTTGEDITPSTNNYTVQSGDSLYSIARRFNTTVDTIKSLNNLTSNNLSIGQVLTLPTTSNDITTNTNTYTVQNGDSLYSIARKFNVTVQDLINTNNLSSTSLSIGQKLIIPNTTPTTPELPETPTSTNTYTVQSGDNLYSIARRFNTTVDAIKSLNNLTSNNLSIGQTLKILSSNTSTSTTNYTVKSGDSLYSIARRFNTTVDTIKKLNSLTSNNLSIGQVLKIPN